MKEREKEREAEYNEIEDVSLRAWLQRLDKATEEYFKNLYRWQAAKEPYYYVKNEKLRAVLIARDQEALAKQTCHVEARTT